MQELEELEEQELRLKRRRLAVEERALEAEERSRHSIVRLNVGGSHFDVGRDSLMSEGTETYFGLMLRHRDDGLGSAQEDADGRLFIDRDPDVFKLVLAGLRGSLLPHTLSDGTIAQLLGEVEFFQLPKLAVRLRDEYDPYVLPPAAQERRRQAISARNGLPGETAAADALLIDVFSHVSSFKFTGAGYDDHQLLLDRRTQHKQLFDAYKATSAMQGVLWNNTDELRLLAEKERRRAEGLPAQSLESFRESFRLYAGELFDGLDMTNLVIAGGAVLSTLLIPSEWAHGDVDSSEGNHFRMGISSSSRPTTPRPARATSACCAT